MKLCEMLDRSNLTELFDTKVDYDVVMQRASIFVTKSTIGNRIIKFVAEASNEPETWDITFSEHTNDTSPGKYGITGNGNELAVFRMVKDSIMEFISIYHPENIFFTADNDDNSDTRSNTYERLIRRFSLPGYHYVRTDCINAGYSNFSIVKESNILSLNKLFQNKDILY